MSANGELISTNTGLNLDLEIPSGRHGIAYGTSLSQMLTDAEEALFYIDEVLQELGVLF